MDAGMMRGALTSLYDDTPDAVVLYDERGCVVASNEAAQLLAGYTAEELEGSSFRDHIAAGEVERVEVALRTALAGGSDHFDTGARHKDGSIVPIECYMFAAKIDGKIVGAFAQARDSGALRSAEAALTMNQEKFRSLFEYHPDGIMELKATGAISRVNVGLESETGYYGEQLVGKPWTELVAPERRNAADDGLRAAMRGEATELESLLLDRLGNRIDVQLKLVPLHIGGAVHGAYAIFKSVTAQKNAERAMATQREQIRRLYLVAASRGESLDDQIDATLKLGLELFGWDQGYVAQFQRDRVLIRNAVGESQMSKGTIYPMQAALSRHVAYDKDEFFIPDVSDPEWRDDPARTTAPWRSYFVISLGVFDERYGALVLAGRAPRDGMEQREHDIVQLMGLFIAAALERAAQNERIEQMAFTDALTGLPNRVLFNDRIEHTIATARRYDRGFAVMYVDIDKFKDINDRYGHSTGDAVLKAVADRLRESLRESDTVSRFGGDEFVILQPIVDGPSDAADLARKLNVAMQRAIEIDATPHEVRISIGIALYPGDGLSIEALMEASDRALYRAKRDGRNRWCFANQDVARRDLANSRLGRKKAAE
ncbi:MAG TPA: diguanylate cyclase [Candidatus Baltobacteraceae bacterium]|jgi:diguanylate cyclase (GGDEF)-like protein/PAS domain S-box-containing protein|nr:diguanylate cyclase [Candidatus Baltobacteraceae bacterium]